MNYEPVIRKLKYWKNYKGKGDDYRKTHDLDCVLTNGNLYADTIISLWLPLRYTLNFFEIKEWTVWKEYEAEVLKGEGKGLKDCDDFLEDIINKIEIYLPEEHPLTRRIVELFQIGQTRANVMILPYRKWNTDRGRCPYWDYLPHYLFDLLDTDSKIFLEAIKNWIKEEDLEVFFEDGIIDKDHIKDLAGTGNVCKHSPREIEVSVLLDNYISVLKERQNFVEIEEERNVI